MFSTTFVVFMIQKNCWLVIIYWFLPIEPSWDTECRGFSFFFTISYNLLFCSPFSSRFDFSISKTLCSGNKPMPELNVFSNGTIRTFWSKFFFNLSSSSLLPSELEKFKIFVLGSTFPKDEAAKIRNNNIFIYSPIIKIIYTI